MRIKYEGRHPVHAVNMEGNSITLTKNLVVDVKELPKEGGEYCKVLDQPVEFKGTKVEVGKSAKKKKSK